MDNIEEKSGIFGEYSWELNDEGTLRLFPTDGDSGRIPSMIGLHPKLRGKM